MDASPAVETPKYAWGRGHHITSHCRGDGISLPICPPHTHTHGDPHTHGRPAIAAPCRLPPTESKHPDFPVGEWAARRDGAAMRAGNPGPEIPGWPEALHALSLAACSRRAALQIALYIKRRHVIAAACRIVVEYHSHLVLCTADNGKHDCDWLIVIRAVNEATFHGAARAA